MKQMLVTVMMHVMCPRRGDCAFKLQASSVARNNSCHSSRRCTRHTRGRYQSRHSALSDGLRRGHWRVLYNLLAARRAHPPDGARVVRIFCKEKLYCLLLVWERYAENWQLTCAPA